MKRTQPANSWRSAVVVSTVFSVSIRIGLVLLLWMPLVITPGTIYPFIVGKALYARGVIEIVTALWVVLLLWNPRYRPPRSWVLLAFAVYVLIALLSAAAGVSFTHSLWSDYQRMVGVWDLVHWFLFALVTTSLLRSAQAWRSLLNWNLGVALVLSLLALAQVFGIPGLPLPYRSRVDATLGNPSYLAAILTTTTLIAVGFLAHSFLGTKDEEAISPWWRVFWALSAALGVWVLFLTGTRGALVGLVAGAGAMPLALAIWGNREALKTVALAASGVMVAVALLFALDYAGLPVHHRSPEQSTAARVMSTSLQEGSVAVRLKLVSVGVQGFLERPLLGWGPANFARVFDRFATASFYRYTKLHQDQAHNKLVEELATKGALGTLSYGALWAALVWAIVRRRRRPREETLAYAVLGALAAYFVQNLFLFDTPAMLLQWALLVSWSAAQEQPMPGRHEEPPPGSKLTRPGVGWTGALMVLLLLGVSLYFLNYRPYHAARLFFQAYYGPGPLEYRLSLAQKSFDTFPALATMPRRFMLSKLVQQWEGLSLEERGAAVSFAVQESERGLQAAPNNARLIARALLILQAVAASPEELEQLQPLVQRLRELAPERVYTYGVLAFQELKKGDYQEVLRIVEEFESKAPWVGEGLRPMRQAAQEGLNRK